MAKVEIDRDSRLAGTLVKVLVAQNTAFITQFFEVTSKIRHAVWRSRQRGRTWQRQNSGKLGNNPSPRADEESCWSKLDLGGALTTVALAAAPD